MDANMYPKKQKISNRGVNVQGFSYKKSRTPSGRGTISNGWTADYTGNPHELSGNKMLAKGKLYIDGVDAKKFRR